MTEPRFEAGPFHLPAEETFGFLEVPGGAYRLGDTPGIEIELSPFWIARLPTTAKQFRAFAETSDLHLANREVWSRLADDEPAVAVNWEEARAYCRRLDQELRRIASEKAASSTSTFWSGFAAGELQVRLPTEAEWEASARGRDGRIYPWGDERPDAERANFLEHVGRITPVDGYPRGMGPYGALDQAGNVWEWCLDAWSDSMIAGRNPMSLNPEIKERVLRGGAWFVLNPRTASRSSCSREYRPDYVGFRAVVGRLVEA